eukprot:8334118-Karenia_brevis.AAC.1
MSLSSFSGMNRCDNPCNTKAAPGKCRGPCPSCKSILAPFCFKSTGISRTKSLAMPPSANSIWKAFRCS